MTEQDIQPETSQQATETQAEPAEPTEPFEGAPSIVKHKQMRPFGADKAHALMMKREAIRTLPRQVAFDRGYLTVKDLDDEELRYGRCRDETGHIPKNGRKTELIPQERFDEMIAEHEMRFKQKLRQNLDDMLEIAIEIAKDPTVEPRDRFEASKYLMERVVGKTPETVNVNIKAAPWEELMGQVTGIAPMSRSEHRQLQGAGIVDAEVVDIQEDGSEHDQADVPITDDQGQRDNIPDPEAQDPVQPQDLPENDTSAPIPPVVSVHQARPSEPDSGQPVQSQPQSQPQATNTQPGTRVGQEPSPGEPYSEYVEVPVGPDTIAKVDNQRPPLKTTDEPGIDPSLDYGRRADQKRTYAEQARDAQDLARRRKERRDAVQNAKKQRKIARALGADAIEDEITGATVSEDGQVTFE